ncbi:hypothetical protein FB45DRAFT_1005066 [Roridomyces roridus]|uniref:Uncharacterized protein n=1 Tax=Roridomyces roridus TaxID=1738132 RepID=A0AAD7BN53_9AGAR|nr:hypothetical protein FB45DRAFT_1005066 [Roridomyces roridus]
MQPGGQPRSLPADVERCIFESAAYLHPECIPSLLLVARRVNLWTEHVLHRVLTALVGRNSKGTVVAPNYIRRHSPRSLPIFLDSKPREFFHSHVRHVRLVGVPLAEMVRTLSLCDETTDLSLWDVVGAQEDDNNTPLLAVLGTLPLQRLSIYFRRGAMDFSSPFFVRLTHLDLPGAHSDRWADWEPLALLPQLTHLSFSEDFHSTPIFKNLLQYCPSLQALVVLFSAPALLNLLAGVLRVGVPDARFVVLLVLDRDEDWETGARGGEDYWILAEEEVVQNRRRVRRNDIDIDNDRAGLDRDEFVLSLAESPAGCQIA